LQGQPQSRRHQLHFAKLQAMAGRVAVPNHRDANEVGHDFFEKLQPLGALIGCNERQSGDVSARPRQAGDVAGGHRIADRRHDDGNGAGRFAGSLDRLCCVRDDDIDVCANKLGGKHG
jgi:hypothetical protein